MRLTQGAFDAEGRPVGTPRFHVRARGMAHARGRHAPTQLKSSSKPPDSQPAAVHQKTVDAEVPEPRPNSAEWWRRENVKVGKAIIICRVCLTQAATADVSTAPKKLPTDLSSNGPM